LDGEGVRAEADLSSGRMGAKIRAAQIMKIPYMIVVGNKEIENDTVAVRMRDGRQENDVSRQAFIMRVKGKIEERSSEL
jgi:threonyl-tRNA synthetase